MQIDNVIIDYRDRPQGSESKLNTFSDGFKVLKTIGNLFKNYQPLKFFGIIALAFAALSVGFFIPILIDFIQTGRVDKFPTLFVCCTMMVIGVLFFFTGLILSSMIHKNKQDFEYVLIRTEDEFKRKKLDK